MKLYRLITGLVLSFLFGPFYGTPLATEVDLNQRISTSVSASSGTGIYEKAKTEDGVEYLRKIYELPNGAALSFRPISALIRPKVQNSSGKITTAAGRYFGKIIIENDGFNWKERKEIAEINKKEIFIYEWSIDKSNYLRTLFDQPVANKNDRFHYKEDFAWDTVSTKGLWTSEAARILKTTGRDLIDNAPSDVTDFCPNYNELNEDGRTAFWIHLLNSIVKRESAFDLLVGNDESNFGANGNEVVSRGAMQISYESSRAKAYRQSGCSAKNADDLHNFTTNIQCGVAIFSHWSREDDCISCKSSSGKYLGIARYWSTLRDRYEVPCKICSSGKAKIGYKEQIIAEMKSTKTCADR